MRKVAKLTISLPRSLILCLQEFAEQRRLAELEEGYKEMAEEQRKFAAVSLALAGEVVTEWK